MTDSRQRFEAYIKRKHPDYPSQLWREGEGYVYTQTDWEAWQAAEALREQSPVTEDEIRRRNGGYVQLGNGITLVLNEELEKLKAAERAAAARCAEIAEKLAATYHAAYKSSYHQHDDGMCDGAGEVETAIRAAFPECFE